MDAAGAVATTERAHRSLENHKAVFHSAHRHHCFGKTEDHKRPRLRAGEESDDTQHPYRVAAFQTFLGGRI